MGGDYNGKGRRAGFAIGARGTIRHNPPTMPKHSISCRLST